MTIRYAPRLGFASPCHAITASLTLACMPYCAVAGGAYLTQIAIPGSVGTAGVANVTNNFDPSATATQPAGLTGLEHDSWRVGGEVLIPVNKFDSSIADARGGDGGNAGLAAVIPGIYFNKRLSDYWHFGFGVAGTAGGGLDYGKNRITIKGDGPADNSVNVVDTIDRNFKDTWHVRFALKHTDLEGRTIAGGIGYDSSPVDDKDRTFDLPLDEQVKVALAFGREDKKGKPVSGSIGGSLLWMGDGKIDQTAQDVRTRGKFDTNLL